MNMTHEELIQSVMERILLKGYAAVYAAPKSEWQTDDDGTRWRFVEDDFGWHIEVAPVVIPETFTVCLSIKMPPSKEEP
jgi:hypothetical protein